MENSNNWKDIVAEQITKIVNRSGVKNLDFRFTTRYTIALIWGLIVFGLFLITFGVTGQFVKINNVYLPTWASILMGVIGTLMMLSLIPLLIKVIRQQNIEYKILSQLDLGYVYKLAFDELIGGECKFISLEQKFYTNPILTSDGIRSQINNVINFEYKGMIFSCGVITYENLISVPASVNSTMNKHEYHCVQYMAVNLNKNTNYDVLIQPIAKIGSIDNVDLESYEYEKLFATYADDQILVRKLITPKTMDVLTNLAKTDHDIPIIKFKNNMCCVKFSQQRVVGFNDPHYTFGLFELTEKNKVIEEICNKVEKDIMLVKKGFEWVSAFNIFN